MSNFQTPEETTLAVVRAEGAELDLLHRVLYARGGFGAIRPTSSPSCIGGRITPRRPSGSSSTAASRTTSSPMTASTPSRPPGCGTSSSPTARSWRAGGRSCYNSGGRPSGSALSSRRCLRGAWSGRRSSIPAGRQEDLPASRLRPGDHFPCARPASRPPHGKSHCGGAMISEE